MPDAFSSYESVLGVLPLTPTEESIPPELNQALDKRNVLPAQQKIGQQRTRCAISSTMQATSLKTYRQAYASKRNDHQFSHCKMFRKRWP